MEMLNHLFLFCLLIRDVLILLAPKVLDAIFVIPFQTISFINLYPPFQLQLNPFSCTNCNHFAAIDVVRYMQIWHCFVCAVMPVRNEVE